ncbi:hypothetical protein B0H14DRAFT_2809255, partial [Mycena olivaceomarginata]
KWKVFSSTSRRIMALIPLARAIYGSFIISSSLLSIGTHRTGQRHGTPTSSPFAANTSAVRGTWTLVVSLLP